MRVKFSERSVIDVLDDRAQTARKQFSEFKNRCLKKTFKISSVNHDLGAISIFGTSHFLIVYGIVNQIKYLKDLPEHLMPQSKDCNGDGP